MILHFLRLIRTKNLLIIAFTQYMMRYAVIFPVLKFAGYESQFSNINFLLLVLATISLTAAGYVINDYFDTKTDLLNRPKKVIVGKHINRRLVMIFHVVLNVIGIGLGFYISYQIGLIKLGYIYILITGLLWFYSTSYKRQFLTGNIIVALLTGMVPLMTVLYEIPPLNVYYAETLMLLKQNFNILFFWAAGFSGFAFITTIAREIIKDVEDFEGDTAFGRRTLPVKSGIKTSKIVISTITGVTTLAIIYVALMYLQCSGYSKEGCISTDYLSLIYIFILLIIPNLFLIYKVLKAETQKDWHFASSFAKLIMLFGILYSLVIYYNYSF